MLNLLQEGEGDFLEEGALEIFLGGQTARENLWAGGQKHLEIGGA